MQGLSGKCSGMLVSKSTKLHQIEVWACGDESPKMVCKSGKVTKPGVDELATTLIKASSFGKIAIV